jgi:hypothetical protein
VCETDCRLAACRIWCKRRSERVHVAYVGLDLQPRDHSQTDCIELTTRFTEHLGRGEINQHMTIYEPGRTPHPITTPAAAAAANTEGSPNGGASALEVVPLACP